MHLKNDFYSRLVSKPALEAFMNPEGGFSPGASPLHPVKKIS